MLHTESKRIIPGADRAVLFIHGIVGGPGHFREAIKLEEAVPEDCSCCNLLLPGHGQTVGDFSRSSMDAWRTYARDTFLELSRSHREVVIVAHSMGTLFAMQLAVEFPEKVPFLFLLGVPLRPWMRFFGFINCLRLTFGRIREDKPREVAIRNACSVACTPLLWRYIPWIPRYLELFGEIRRTERDLGKLKVPCTAWQSRKDELVGNATAGLLRSAGVMEVHELEESSHFYYTQDDAQRILTDFKTKLAQQPVCSL